MSDLWSAISALSSAIGTGLVIVAAIYARGQVREARQTREVELIQNIYQRFNELEIRNFRTRLMRGEIADVAVLSPIDRDLLARNLDQLEFIAIAVERGLLDFDMVYSVFPNSPPQLWALANKLSWTRANTAYANRPLARLIARYAARRDSWYWEEDAKAALEQSQPTTARESADSPEGADAPSGRHPKGPG